MAVGGGVLEAFLELIHLLKGAAGAHSDTADGIFGKASMKAWQKYLNDRLYADNAEPTGPPAPDINYKVIDVSEFQSTINWDKVKAAGIKGVIVRCGFRGGETGKLKADAAFLDHIQGAAKAGLKLGIYLFTQGVTAAEGKAEADYALKQMEKAGVKLAYPIAIDTESMKNGK